jgi:transposase
MGHLQYRDGDWYLHAPMQKETDDQTAESIAGHRTVFGVDLGVNTLVVTSTGTFWSADGFNHRRREYEKRRDDLQQCASRHAHENINPVGRKETGRFDIYLHRVANELITETIENDCSHIVFEDLTHILMNLPEASWQHIWAFRRILSTSSTRP